MMDLPVTVTILFEVHTREEFQFPWETSPQVALAWCLVTVVGVGKLLLVCSVTQRAILFTVYVNVQEGKVGHSTKSPWKIGCWDEC
jgi:hypothetical protein